MLSYPPSFWYMQLSPHRGRVHIYNVQVFKTVEQKKDTLFSKYAFIPLADTRMLVQHKADLMIVSSIWSENVCTAKLSNKMVALSITSADSDASKPLSRQFWMVFVFCNISVYQCSVFMICTCPWFCYCLSLLCRFLLIFFFQL